MYFLILLLPPRESFVIVKFRVLLNLSRNIIRGVRNLDHMIMDNNSGKIFFSICSKDIQNGDRYS